MGARKGGNEFKKGGKYEMAYVHQGPYYHYVLKKGKKYDKYIAEGWLRGKGSATVRLGADEKLPDELQTAQAEKAINGTEGRVLALEDAVMKEFKEGRSAKHAIRFIAKTYGYSQSLASKYVAMAVESIKAAIFKERNNIAARNALTLQEIVNDSMLKKNYKTALDAISELNKMAHVYDNVPNVNVTNNFGFDFDTSEGQDDAGADTVVVDCVATADEGENENGTDGEGGEGAR